MRYTPASLTIALTVALLAAPVQDCFSMEKKKEEPNGDQKLTQQTKTTNSSLSSTDCPFSEDELAALLYHHEELMKNPTNLNQEEIDYLNPTLLISLLITLYPVIIPRTLANTYGLDADPNEIPTEELPQDLDSDYGPANHNKKTKKRRDPRKKLPKGVRSLLRKRLKEQMENRKNRK